MLQDDLDLDSILDVSPFQMAEFCDQHLDIRTLIHDIEERNPFDRKRLCEYLGIGESTLSGWLKEGRIPQMAKNAFVLLGAHRLLAREVRTLRAQLDEVRAKDFKVVRIGEHFQVCEFEEDEEGEVVGRVVAERIGTIEDARMLASGHRALRRARDTYPLFDYVDEMTENSEFRRLVKEIELKLDAHELFVTDHEKWKERFGKKSCAEAFSKLVAEITQDLKGSKITPPNGPHGNTETNDD